MKALEYTYDDGGRAAAGYKGVAHDCVVRAITLATGDSYAHVYRCTLDQIRWYRELEAMTIPGEGSYRASIRYGVPIHIMRVILMDRDWQYTAVRASTLSLRYRPELPSDCTNLIVSLSGYQHVAAIVGNVVRDIHDSRQRTLDGFWAPSPVCRQNAAGGRVAFLNQTDADLGVAD